MPLSPLLVLEAGSGTKFEILPLFNIVGPFLGLTRNLGACQKCNTHIMTLIHIICGRFKCHTCMIILKCTLYMGEKCNSHIMTLIHTICGNFKCNTCMTIQKCTLYIREKCKSHIMTLIHTICGNFKCNTCMIIKDGHYIWEKNAIATL